ncbi:sheath initiation protein [Bacillus phage vB_BceM-HSE3]|nr:sheath initiation protein [Bacillus phage vB_BceM-HSE3]
MNFGPIERRYPMDTRDYPLPEHTKKLIGKGIAHPTLFDETKGTTNTSEGLERINQSIFNILATTPGERWFMPSFGSNLARLIFEPNDSILRDLLQLEVGEALRRWEKRIVIDDIMIAIDDMSGNQVNITIIYHLANSNIQGSYVYPFRRKVFEYR